MPALGSNSFDWRVREHIARACSSREFINKVDRLLPSGKMTDDLAIGQGSHCVWEDLALMTATVEVVWVPR